MLSQTKHIPTPTAFNFPQAAPLPTAGHIVTLYKIYKLSRSVETTNMAASRKMRPRSGFNFRSPAGWDALSSVYEISMESTTKDGSL